MTDRTRNAPEDTISIQHIVEQCDAAHQVWSSTVASLRFSLVQAMTQISSLFTQKERERKYQHQYMYMSKWDSKWKSDAVTMLPVGSVACRNDNCHRTVRFDYFSNIVCGRVNILSDRWESRRRRGVMHRNRNRTLFVRVSLAGTNEWDVPKVVHLALVVSERSERYDRRTSHSSWDETIEETRTNNCCSLVRPVVFSTIEAGALDCSSSFEHRSLVRDWTGGDDWGFDRPVSKHIDRIPMPTNNEWHSHIWEIVPNGIRS